MADQYGFRPLRSSQEERRLFEIPKDGLNSSPNSSQTQQCSNQSPKNLRPYPPSLPPESSPHIPFRPIHPVNDHVKRAYYWVDTFTRGGVPSTALCGGTDCDGHQIYVGRAYFEGDWIPAKVIPGRNAAYVAFDGLEHTVDRFQVLCEQRFDWVPCHKGNIPPDAVEGGRTCDGEALYIGRVDYKGAHTVGKIHPSHGTCYIPFDGKEIGFQDCEILVLRS